MHPLDLVKTRLQLQARRAPLGGAAPSDPHFYEGVVDCLRKMYRHESIRAYWKGVVPPVLVETPKRAVKVR
jgi:solute carrier family 25 (mitochondrial 2-oxodicarboxylate transporter), member 21